MIKFFENVFQEITRIMDGLYHGVKGLVIALWVLAKEVPWATFMLLGFIPMGIFGPSSIIATAGLAAGVACAALWLLYKIGEERIDYENSTDVSKKEEKTSEADENKDWPNVCYGCGRDIGEVRGELVVHNGNDEKSVGLCEECVKTQSTLLEYMDKFEEIFDNRDAPEEL